MEGVLKALQAVLPFLEQYPVGVRLATALWVLFSAGLLVMFILVPRASLNADPSKVSGEEGAGPAGLMDAPTPSPAVDTTTQTSSALDPASPSLDQVLRALDDPGLTELQRSQFVQRNEGRAVQWEGIVLSVKRAFGRSDSEIHVVFRSPTDPNPPLGGIIIATFPPSAEAHLSPLSEGDYVVIAGTLEFVGSATGHFPSVRNCSLVSFSKPSPD